MCVRSKMFFWEISAMFWHSHALILHSENKKE